jgi:hypothetical protein
MRNEECGQNLLACLMLIRGDKGVDIDVREECGCKMGNGREKNREAGCVLGCVFWSSTQTIGNETDKARKK